MPVAFFKKNLIRFYRDIFHSYFNLLYIVAYIRVFMVRFIFASSKELPEHHFS